MRFVKMHGAGNDYIYIDAFTQPAPTHPTELARELSDRHTGIGSDGLIVVEPCDTADARMQMWNADGSRAEMCGNGLRCVAKLLYDRGHCRRSEMRIATDAGERSAWPEVDNRRVDRVRVSMGIPQLQADEIPVHWDGIAPGSQIIDEPIPIAARPVLAGTSPLRITCVSMGNPHCVVFVDQFDDRANPFDHPTVQPISLEDDLQKFGPVLERHMIFPQRTNVEVVEVVSRDEVRVAVWERGTGPTQACGTGACAVAVAGALTDRTGRRVRCRLPGGMLEVEWPDDDNSRQSEVYLTGPAVEVFEGTWLD